MRGLSREVVVLDRLLACCGDASLYLRRLIVSPMEPSNPSVPKQQRRKRKRERADGALCVFGCALCNVMHVLRGRQDHVAAESVRTLRNILESPARTLSTSRGADFEHLYRGFASTHIASEQFGRMDEACRNPVTHRRRERNDDVALGAGVSLFAALAAASEDAENSAALLFVIEYHLGAMATALCNWTTQFPVGAMPADHRAALAAEQRALDRADVACRAGRRAAKELELDTYNTVRLVLACMRRAMWPQECVIEKSTQAGLCAWIGTEAFLDEEHVPVVVKPCGPGDVRVPLSALSALPESGRGGSDATSGCDDGSSISGSSSYCSYCSSARSGSSCDSLCPGDGHNADVQEVAMVDACGALDAAFRLRTFL